MAKYFLNGFFDDRVHVIPDGAIPLSDAEYAELFAAQREGKQIVMGDGFPIAVDPPPAVPTVEDYDRALENHLREVRSARGYTLREPSDYVGSSVPRWAQDAADWIKYRDEVLLYGLGVQNAVAAGGEIPSLESFLAGMPVITWSYVEQQ